MMSATLPKYPAFDLYTETFAAAERAMGFWGELYRTSAEVALWWVDRWLQLPLTVLSFTPAIEPEEAREILAEATEAVVASFTAPALEALKAAPDIPPVIEAMVAAEVASVEAVADDLTRLVGIGPRVAALLAERGVTTFSQIAAWTEEEAARIDREMNLMGRVTREAWVDQARQFAENL